MNIKPEVHIQSQTRFNKSLYNLYQYISNVRSVARRNEEQKEKGTKHSCNGRDGNSNTVPQTPTSGTFNSSSTRKNCAPTDSCRIEPECQYPLYIELFHNLHTQIRNTFDPNRSIAWLTDNVDYLITTPYLINALLAFSALHLSTTRPRQRE